MLFSHRQILIIQQQRERELDSFTYIADRGIDNLVYSKMYCDDAFFQNLLATDSAKDCIARYQSRGSRNFLLVPQKEFWYGLWRSLLCVLTFRKDDGVRMFTKFEESLRFTEVMKQLFDDLKIPYFRVDQTSLVDRLSFLEECIT
jgi:hypothetical protein